MAIHLFLFFIGLTTSFLQAQNYIGAVNSGASSNNQSPYSIGEIFVVGTSEKNSSSGTLGVFSTILKTTNGILSLVKSDFSVFPNPAKNEISLKIENSSNKLFEIYDLNGKYILSKIYDNNPIDISTLSNGTYILKNQTKSIKFSKQ